MAYGTGSVVIDFGAFPGSNEASVDVTGQTDITALSKAEAYIMGDDSTSDHTASDHRYLGQLASFTCGTPVAGVGFTIYGRSIHKMQGTFQLRFVWTE